MPVFPLVASMSVESASIIPRRSASSIIERTGRSLTLIGLNSSSLASNVAPQSRPILHS